MLGTWLIKSLNSFMRLIKNVEYISANYNVFFASEYLFLVYSSIDLLPILKKNLNRTILCYIL